MKYTMEKKSLNIIVISLTVMILISILLISSFVFFNMGQSHMGKFNNGNFNDMEMNSFHNLNNNNNNNQVMDHNQMMGDSQNPSHSFSNNGLVPTMPGQDAFGTIGEIVELLNNDPNTAWEKVNISALKEHLMDMDILIQKSVVKSQNIENGAIFEVSSTGKRNIDGIKRMVKSHNDMILSNVWETQITENENGVILKVTSLKDFNKIQGLGFFGIMAYGGNHHQVHHFALAKGEIKFN